MADTADLIRAVASATWVVLALVVVLALRAVLEQRGPSLRSLGIGPTGVSMEFVEQKLDEATSQGNLAGPEPIGAVGRGAFARRVQRNADLFVGARVLWADDHPDNNRPIIELLRRLRATVDTPTSNAEALGLLAANRYDVVLSDMKRDDEGPLAGLDLAEEVQRRHGQRTILFTGRFDPTGVPGLDAVERIELTNRVAASTFGRTSRYDEAVHLILDVLERGRL